ncbi:ABC transporter permease (plasmid) [Haloferacaceae archaeon DSL9]
MSDTIQYLVQRLLWAIPVLLGASFIAFILVHLSPSDPARLMLGDAAQPDQIERLRAELGLDRPLYVQYVDFLVSAAQGDLGQSISERRPVADVLIDRLPYTAQLAGLSMIVSLLIAVPTGIVSAVRRGTIADDASRVTALLGISIPNFWLGLILILLIAVPLSQFPMFGMTRITEDVAAGLYSTILPAIALGTAYAALVMRLLRGGMLDELNKGYTTTARAYGIDNSEITYVYALKNAVLPTITIVGLQLGYLLGGSVVVETVFGIPGIGQLAINSIFTQDFPVIQGIILFVAVAFVFVNIGVDVLYSLLDPRISYGGEE